MNTLRELTTLSFDDYKLFTELCVVYGVYRVVLTNFVIKKLAKLIHFKNETIRTKFVGRLFDLTHYTCSALLGLFAIYTRPYNHCFYFALDCAQEFAQQSEPTNAVVLSGLEKMYYMLFTAYYVVDVFFLGKDNHDLPLMILHHCTTLSLIFISIYIRTQVIGVNVMLLHDLVDVPLYFGKISTYLGLQTAQDVSLLTFAVLCTWFRMINYPFVIYNGIRNGLNETPDHLVFYCIEGCILFSLLFCHICWYIRIVKAAIGIFTQGKEAIRDNRSDGADDE